jgi:hypothetical protein
MKKNLCLLFVVQVLIISFNQIALSQNPKVSSIFSFDKTENISADELKRLQRNEFQTQGKIEDLSEPTLTFINFDDIIIPYENAPDSIIRHPCTGRIMNPDRIMN